MQSIKSSIIEQITMRVVGLTVAAFIIQPIVFPIYNIDIPLQSNFELACIFTASSTVLGFGIRRIFNFITFKSYQRKYNS